ncbi:hypothetical protein AALO_G00199810 [Alosa alosa]|uniref:G-protein coupled receptors family 1 profile domain-containing protein n=1 Tax=Alosa alosa TaxID=278164 RepID=A0AAV6G284_9TELE|nr:hypothetical protein AALO_G00199810 [Alosa alosa]
MTSSEMTAMTTPAFNFNSSNYTTNGSSCDNKNGQVLAYPFFIFGYALVFLISLVLNGFTLKVYFFRSQRNNTTVTIYLQNLVISDLFLSLCLPLRVANYVVETPAMRQIYCSFGASAFYLNMYASIIFMDYIAANRYLKIVRPLETNILQTPRAARIISIVTWTFLGGTALLYMVISLISSRENVKFARYSVGCESLHSQRVSQLYKAVHTVSAAIFFFVLVSLVFLYHGTTRRLRQAQKSQQSESGCRKLAKSKRNMLILVSMFCVCFVPYHLVRLPYAFLKQKLTCFTWAHAFFTLKEATVLLSVCNACLDPFIYFIFCKAFRAQLGLRKEPQGPSSSVTEVRRLSMKRGSLKPLNAATIIQAMQPNK